MQDIIDGKLEKRRAGVFGAVFEYGIERKITSFSTVGASMSVGVPTGVMVRLK